MPRRSRFSQSGIPRAARLSNSGALLTDATTRRRPAEAGQKRDDGNLATGRRSPCGHGRTQLQWRVDHVERLETASRAADRDVAVVEKPAEQCLIDVDAFDLIHVHFDRMPANQASLEDDAAIGDGYFRSPSAEPGGHKRHDGRDGEGDGG